MDVIRTRLAIAAATALAVITPASMASAHGMQSHRSVAQSVAIDRYAHYVVGRVSASGMAGSTDWEGDFAVRWTVADAASVCSQRLFLKDYDTIHWIHIDLPLDQRRYVYHTTQNRDFRLGTSFKVRVSDCDGHETTSRIAMVDAHNVDAHALGDHRTDRFAAVAYTGDWRTADDDSPCATGEASPDVACAWQTTTESGASFEVTGITRGPLGILMNRGPSHGAADVYVDGMLVTTVHTHAATDKQTTVAWTRNFGPGTHTVTLVNKASAAHPSIEITGLLY